MDILDRINDVLLEEESYWEDDMIESLMEFVSTLDLDNLTECQIEKLDEAMDLMEEDEFLNERVKRVVRQGKRQKRKICRPGYKISGNRCVKMKQEERRKRSKGAKRAKRKTRGKQSRITRKRKLSIRRRI